MGMNNPGKVRTHTITALIKDETHAQLITEQLITLEGVLEVMIIIEEQTAYIKVNNQVFALKKAKEILANT